MLGVIYKSSRERSLSFWDFGFKFQVFSMVFFYMHKVTTLTQAFLTPLSFCYAYTLQNKLHKFAALSQKILSSKLQTQNMLTPKHAGFIHTIFLISQSNLLIVYNCPPPKSLLGVQLTGQHRTILCI